ncbi:DUF445 domain-containing protein [Ottowia thiooxydans]|uniref:DUF445 domain-containing protein n=1 Tax=Ottowia thiooxydans TaxID=219182 RepID=UPI0003F5F7AF|nr:DUF445 domain-containing protein [Ottowia thiooxydans]
MSAGVGQSPAGMKRLALGLLVAAAALYMLATWQTPHHSAWGYVAAFAEAAMVGAIADWFAVVALFRHPMGLPIPHTAIIPENKDRIGENLANFLCEHFLATDQVLARLREFDAAGRVATWLSAPANAERVSERLVEVVRWTVGALDDEHVRQFVAELAKGGLRQIELTRVSGQVFEAMTQDRRHQELLDGVLLQLAKLLGEDVVQESITEAIAREIKALKYVGLDQMAARMATRKVVVIIAKTIIDMADDPQHSMRLRFDEMVTGFVQRLKDDPSLLERGERLKAELLDNPAVGSYVNQLWTQLLGWLVSDIGRADSSIRARITQAAQTLGERLAGDEAIRSWINGELQTAAPQLIARYREDIRRYIVARVQAWDAKEMTSELEHHIGRDLQFIRINGTLVGGVVGLVIHALTNLWKAG